MKSIAKNPVLISNLFIIAENEEDTGNARVIFKGLYVMVEA